MEDADPAGSASCLCPASGVLWPWVPGDSMQLPPLLVFLPFFLLGLRLIELGPGREITFQELPV